MKDQEIREMEWPYPIRWGKEKTVSVDVLILGGGIAGCWAAIAAAKNGRNDNVEKNDQRYGH